ncbi:MAG: hypothetical protein WCK77_08415 [Verrucomicrobiota bacterium]
MDIIWNNIGVVCVVVIASWLPAWATFNSIQRSRKEGKWIDELWNEHQKRSTGAPDEFLHDDESRRKLRNEMRDLTGLSAESSAVSLRGGILTFLCLVEAALLWHLAHHDPSIKHLFWVASVTAIIVLVLICVTVTKLDRFR